MRVVPDEVGLDQVMRDPGSLGLSAAGGAKDVAHKSLEPVMSNDQVTLPLSG